MLDNYVIREVCNLIAKLLRDYGNYFDRYGYMNSEGRKVFERAVHLLLEEDPSFRRIVYRVRRDGSFEAVKKLYRILNCS
jgi:hypothetical protein